MITLPCVRCGTPMPLSDESRLVCGKCQAEREVKWFASPRAYERWFHWAYFDRARQAAAIKAART
jgi:hypothetical protein